MSSTIQWNLLDSQNVVCSSSDWQPSFFVNSDSLLNVKITGNIYIPSNTNDDDFVGFVFGYKSPTIGTASNDNRFYLFDWKKVAQHAPTEFGGYMAYEGFNLSYANGIFPRDPINTYKYFWGHESSDNFVQLASNYGNNLGWEYNTTYQFTLIFTYNNIQISIDNDLIFNVSGCFEPGLFGLYSLNQNGAKYSNIEIQQYYGLKIDTEQQTYCEEQPVHFSFLDSTCFSMPSSLLNFEWNFGDSSINSSDPFPEHIFLDAGTYEVQLIITNTEGCRDTIIHIITIEPKPQISSHPENVNCYVGDHIEFSIEAEHATEYQWYFQSRDMNYWSRLFNNGTFTGVQTPVLQVYNVRQNYDEMKFRCIISGECNNLVTSSYGQILITDIPVRGNLIAVDLRLCTYDSTTLVINLQEPSLIKAANLRILFDSSAFEISRYITYFQNIDFDVDISTNFINFSLNVLSPVNMQEAIIASINFNSKANESALKSFVWDNANTYFIDEAGDTLLNFLYSADIQLYNPIHPTLPDSINICLGDILSVDNDNYNYISWSNGSNQPSTVYNEEGVFWVSVIDTNSCQSSDTFYLKPEQTPSAAERIAVGREFYCSFDDSLQIEIIGGSGSHLNWSYLDKTFSDSLGYQPIYQIENPGQSFTISAFWSNFCGASDIVEQEVIVFPESTPAIEVFSLSNEIYPGDLVQFELHTEDKGDNPHFVWVLDGELLKMGADSTMSTVVNRNNQMLKVILYSDARCISGSTSAMDSLLIRLMPSPEFHIPTLVTPNNDGLNDSFKVEFGDKNVVKYNLQIFDLTGRKIFSSTNYLEAWVGENLPNPEVVKMLTYYLVFQYEHESEKVYSGKFMFIK